MNHCLCNNNISKWGSRPSADNLLERTNHMWRQVTNTDWLCLNGFRKGTKDRESPSWRKLKTAAIEKIHQALSTHWTWLLPKNMTPEPACQTETHSANSVQIPSTTYPRAPEWEGPFSLPPWAPFPCLFNSAHRCLENKALWNERPSLSELRGLGHHLHDNPLAKAWELMTDRWDESMGIGGWLLLLGEEKRTREAWRRDS